MLPGLLVAGQLQSTVPAHPLLLLLCSDPAKYLSALLLSLSTMLHLELPQARGQQTSCAAGQCRAPGSAGRLPRLLKLALCPFILSLT